MITQNPSDLKRLSVVQRQRCVSALDIINNCIDTIYALMRTKYPKVYRPQVFIKGTDEVNACATYLHGTPVIIVNWGLVDSAAALLKTRYTKEKLKRNDVLQSIPHSTALAGFRVYLWRYIVLHELYHLWHGHHFWLSNYYVDKNGSVIKKPLPINENIILSETVLAAAGLNNGPDPLTMQAIEWDADSCAISMLVNLMMHDVESRGVPEENRSSFIQTEIGLMMGALATAFCLFDHNSGAKFEALRTIKLLGHPLPSIRMLNAEWVTNAMLLQHFNNDHEKVLELQSQWQRIICDVEADHEGVVDMGQVFYYTAYTEIAQKWIFEIEERLALMQETLAPMIVSNNLGEDYLNDNSVLIEYVWFDEDGTSLRGWINPATGEKTAIKAHKSLETTAD